MEARPTLAGLRDRMNIKLDMRFRFKQLLTGQAILIIKKSNQKAMSFAKTKGQNNH